MTRRVNLAKAAPGPYDALMQTSRAAGEQAVEAGLDARLTELVKLRTSQINGCAFCLRLHTRDLLELGEEPDRLAVLPAWAETTWFSDTDRAALALCEAITNVADGHVPDHVVRAAGEHLTEAQVAAVSWLTIVMNAMNRVAITSRYPVGPA